MMEVGVVRASGREGLGRRARLGIALVCGALIGAAAASCRPADSGFLLRLRLEEGSEYCVRVLSDMSGYVWEDDGEIGGSWSNEYDYRVEVTDVDAEGYAWFEFSTEFMMIDYGDQRFDSDQPLLDLPDHMIVPAAAVGHPFLARLSPLGEVLEIAGLETMRSETVGELDKVDPYLPIRSIEAMVELVLTEDSLMELVGYVVIGLPESPLSIGDSWTATKVSSGVVATREFVTYTLESCQDGLATVTSLSTLSGLDAEGAVDSGGIGTTYRNVSGRQAGSLLIDLDTGWVVQSRSEYELSVEVVARDIWGGEVARPMTLSWVSHLQALDPGNGGL
jgi:hypothetical protein